MSSLNLPTLTGLLNALNPTIGGWARASEEWTLSRKSPVFTSVSFVATLPEHEPWAAVFSHVSKSARDQYRELIVKKYGARLSHVAEVAIRCWCRSERALARSDLTMDAELTDAWKRHCERYPQAELVDYPVEAFSFFRNLVEDPRSEFARAVVAAMAEEGRALIALPPPPAADVWRGLSGIPGFRPRRQPWWRKWPEKPSDRVPDK